METTRDRPRRRRGRPARAVAAATLAAVACGCGAPAPAAPSSASTAGSAGPAPAAEAYDLDHPGGALEKAAAAVRADWLVASLALRRDDVLKAVDGAYCAAAGVCGALRIDRDVPHGRGKLFAAAATELDTPGNREWVAILHAQEAFDSVMDADHAAWAAPRSLDSTTGTLSALKPREIAAEARLTEALVAAMRVGGHAAVVAAALKWGEADEVLRLFGDVDPAARAPLLAHLGTPVCLEELLTALDARRALDLTRCAPSSAASEAPVSYLARRGLEALLEMRKTLDAARDPLAATMRAAGLPRRADEALPGLRVPLPLPAKLSAPGFDCEVAAADDLLNEPRGRLYAAIRGREAFVGAWPVLWLEGGTPKISSTPLPGRPVGLDGAPAVVAAAVRRALDGAAADAPDARTKPSWADADYVPADVVTVLADGRAPAAEALTVIEGVARGERRLELAVATKEGVDALELLVPGIAPGPVPPILIRVAAARLVAEWAEPDRTAPRRVEATSARALRDALVAAGRFIDGFGQVTFVPDRAVTLSAFVAAAVAFRRDGDNRAYPLAVRAASPPPK